MTRKLGALAAAALAAAMGLSACGGAGASAGDFLAPSFTSRLAEGDRRVSWALTYYDSWNRDKQPRYLLLAEDHALNAIRDFATLQSDTSPRIQEFYVARDRRVRSCRLLAELQFTAANNGFPLNQAPVGGCLF